MSLGRQNNSVQAYVSTKPQQSMIFFFTKSIFHGDSTAGRKTVFLPELQQKLPLNLPIFLQAHFNLFLSGPSKILLCPFGLACLLHQIHDYNTTYGEDQMETLQQRALLHLQIDASDCYWWPLILIPVRCGQYSIRTSYICSNNSTSDKKVFLMKNSIRHIGTSLLSKIQRVIHGIIKTQISVHTQSIASGSSSDASLDSSR